MNKRIIGLFIVGLLALSVVVVNIDMAKAESENPFENAVPVTTGTYKGEFSKSNRVDSYIFQGKAGYELRIKVTLVGPDPLSHSGCYVHLYNEDREEISCTGSGWNEHCYSYKNQPDHCGFSWLSSSDRTYYIVIQHDVGTVYAPYTLSISSVERYDANSGRDAGDTPDTACKISEGKYEGYLAGAFLSKKYYGDDKNDVYTVHLGEDQTINVKITPTGIANGKLDGSIAIALFDQDWEEISQSQDYSKNRGAIVRASWEAPFSQDIYILVTTAPEFHTGYGWDSHMSGGPYTLEVDIEGEEPTPTPKPTPTFSPSPTPSPIITPTPTLTSPKPTPQPKSTPISSPIEETPTLPPTSARTPEPAPTPAFEATFAIAGLLGVAYLLRRRK